MDAKQKAVALALACGLAIPAEGLIRHSYLDPANIITVCWGHTGGDVQQGREYSIDECKALLDKDMLRAIEAVDRCVPGLPTKALAAFGDAAFNLGPRVACDPKYSTAARLLQAGDIPGACTALLRFSKARVAGVMVELRGLKIRRELERDLCLS